MPLFAACSQKAFCLQPDYFMDNRLHCLQRFFVMKNALGNLGSVKCSFLAQIFLAQYGNHLRQSFAACSYCQTCFGIRIKNRQSQAAQLCRNCTFTGSNASRQTYCYHYSPLLLLAMLTINRASAAYLGCLQQRTAFFTGLAASAIHQQMILVIALISFAVLIITEGCTAIFDALRDYRIDCLTQVPYLSSAQAAGFAHRQNAGQSQAFIGINIAKAGKINGSRKQLDKGRQVYAFGAGTQKMYDYLNDNPECMSAPVDYTNDIRSISALDNFISINNAVDIDLFGQVNAESAGVKHISGAGGQLDFVLGAYLSKGGKSFICLSSTFFNKKTGQLESRIRPTLENGSIVTDTRANVHYLCTEYGCVNLKGLTSWEKAEALISVAHPDFREELIREAEKLHIWRRSNKI